MAHRKARLRKLTVTRLRAAAQAIRRCDPKRASSIHGNSVANARPTGAGTSRKVAKWTSAALSGTTSGDSATWRAARCEATRFGVVMPILPRTARSTCERRAAT